MFWLLLFILSSTAADDRTYYYSNLTLADSNDTSANQSLSSAIVTVDDPSSLPELPSSEMLEVNIARGNYVRELSISIIYALYQLQTSFNNIVRIASINGHHSGSTVHNETDHSVNSQINLIYKKINDINDQLFQHSKEMNELSFNLERAIDEISLMNSSFDSHALLASKTNSKALLEDIANSVKGCALNIAQWVPGGAILGGILGSLLQNKGKKPQNNQDDVKQIDPTTVQDELEHLAKENDSEHKIIAGLSKDLSELAQQMQLAGYNNQLQLELQNINKFIADINLNLYKIEVVVTTLYRTLSLSHNSAVAKHNEITKLIRQRRGSIYQLPSADETPDIPVDSSDTSSPTAEMQVTSMTAVQDTYQSIAIEPARPPEHLGSAHYVADQSNSESAVQQEGTPLQIQHPYS